jgi:hypothetical protein
MAKHLQINVDGSENWHLPDDSDVDEVRREIKNALGSEATVVIDVQIRGVRTPLVINGRTLTVCAVYETLPGVAIS